MLETHDPNWERKWKAHFVRIDELNLKMQREPLGPEESREYANLSDVLRLAFDASHRMPDDYIRLHLSLTLREADQLGIWAWYPQVHETADFDATQIAVREVQIWVDTVKHNRETIAACKHAGVEPQTLCALPRPSWRRRYAMLRWRLGRSKRLRGYRLSEGS